MNPQLRRGEWDSNPLDYLGGCITKRWSKQSENHKGKSVEHLFQFKQDISILYDPI